MEFSCNTITIRYSVLLCITIPICLKSTYKKGGAFIVKKVIRYKEQNKTKTKKTKKLF